MGVRKVMISLPPELLEQLDVARRGLFASRSEYIRRAVHEYMGNSRPGSSTVGNEAAQQRRTLRDQVFGLDLGGYKNPMAKAALYELFVSARVAALGQVDKHFFVEFEPGTAYLAVQELQRVLCEEFGEYVVIVDGFVPNTPN